MCGITGFLELGRESNADTLRATLLPMMDAIRHRGPDDSGAWVEPDSGLGLGFRRLAILDLSETGSQPMHSADGKYVIVFNGEIYNFQDLRRELSGAGHTFRGTSDTEVLLAAIVAWGLKEAVDRINGMFAFALWHRPARKLYLVRDRLGVKPLYYGWLGNAFVFGSEIKSMRRYPAFAARIDRNALALFLRHSYIAAPYTIYQDVKKLEPGSILTLDPEDPTKTVQIDLYWSAQEVVSAGLSDPFPDDDLLVLDQLESLLRTSVRERMIADVPLGAFLSGGIDSSTIVALMQAESSRPVKTFTIGFNEPGVNEAEHALSVAKYLGTNHTELYVTAGDALSVIPEIFHLYDEPFADVSQIPTLLVSRLARQQVTVSLSGDGGDELFGGYSRYEWNRQIWGALGWLPAALRTTVGRSATWLAEGVISRLDSARMPGPGVVRLLDRSAKLGGMLDARDFQEMYFNLVSLWDRPAQVVLGADEPLTALRDPDRWPASLGQYPWMMYVDLVTYLPDDILVKLDRASMAASLEGRVPFLDDHRVVEFAWRLPHHFKRRDGVQKWALRQVLHRYVPRELVERPKQGFEVPIGKWLRGELRPWAEDLLSESRIKAGGYFDPAPIREKWSQHLSGKRNWQFALWTVLVFQAWLQAQE